MRIPSGRAGDIGPLDMEIRETFGNGATNAFFGRVDDLGGGGLPLFIRLRTGKEDEESIHLEAPF